MIRVFSYGLDLDLSLLHTIVGGPRPRCNGPALLRQFNRGFGVSGHLPALVSRYGGQVEGALTLVTSDQLQRMDAWLLGYRRRWASVVRLGGRDVRAWVYLPIVTLEPPGRPSLATLSAMCRGVAERGVGDRALRQLLCWRPQDERLLLSAVQASLGGAA